MAGTQPAVPTEAPGCATHDERLLYLGSRVALSLVMINELSRAAYTGVEWGSR